MTSKTPLTYKAAGVDIDAQDQALAQARDSIRATFTPGVRGDVGLFGGLFDLARMGVGEGLLVASADGVGTKIEVARQAGIYSGVGRDLVQHCIGDILVQGARPLFFMDYVGVGKLEPGVVAQVIGGCAEACREHGIALLGGETAEMPGTYRPGDFDLVGFIVGIVPPGALIDGTRVAPGQVLLGLESAGLHTNGFTLARKILFERMELGLDDRPEELGGATVAEALLAPHRSYLELLWPLVEAKRLAGMAHITGGGLPGNVVRILGSNDAVLNRSAWTPPGLFQLLVRGGDVEPDEAYRAFNMGIGMVLAVDPGEVPAVRAHLEGQGERVIELGSITAGSGAVRWS